MTTIHIPKIMSTGLFVNNRIMKEIIPSTEDGETKFTINYELNDKADYDDYISNFAPNLQKEHTEKFLGNFKAIRSVMEDLNFNTS